MTYKVCDFAVVRLVVFVPLSQGQKKKKNAPEMLW